MGVFSLYLLPTLSLPPSLNNHHVHSLQIPLSLLFPTSPILLHNIFPLGLFVGYGSILKESRFLKPAEQLLEGSCDVGCEIYVEKITSSSSSSYSPLMDLSSTAIFSRDGAGEDRSKKSRQISMLDEIDKQVFVDKHEVPSGPNPEESPGTPPLVFGSKRKVPTGPQGFLDKHEVPSGPNPEESPGTPPLAFGSKRKVPTAPQVFVNKHEVPSGPNPEESPGTPPLAFGSKRKVPTGPNPEEPPALFFGSKRKVPTGPNPEQSPPLAFGSKRKVPTGPNPKEHAALFVGSKRKVPTGPNPEEPPVKDFKV